MSKKTVRHQDLQNEEILTRYGAVNLGPGGVVVWEGLDCTPDQLLQEPGFVDGELFPYRMTMEEATAAMPKAEPTSEKKGPNYEGHLAVLKELIAKNARVNSEGYVDMETFTAALKLKELPLITGTLRKELQDSLKNAG